jgi:4-hydroxy-3-polyprenylbenzoate decarboxylase
MVPEIVDMEMPVEGVFHNLVITKINKEYAGQGQKVMNAMWGAGQMMFNKILVITASLSGSGQSFKISDYLNLARDVFKNLNPATDIYFSQGPMDVLDHSCSKMGFGGKMCIDGTEKLQEEVDDNYALQTPDLQLEETRFKSLFPEISAVNTSLIKVEIPCLVISVQKNRKNHIRELHEQICALEDVEGVKMILYVEHTVDANDLATALWRFCNNLDPKRDHLLYQRPVQKISHSNGQQNEEVVQSPKLFACMGFDGTRKTKEWDGFHRDWPNIIVASDETIKSVDDKWPLLGIGPLIPSPSQKFRKQLYGEEAVVQQDMAPQ